MVRSTRHTQKDGSRLLQGVIYEGTHFTMFKHCLEFPTIITCRQEMVEQTGVAN